MGLLYTRFPRRESGSISKRLHSEEDASLLRRFSEATNRRAIQEARSASARLRAGEDETWQKYLTALEVA